MSCLLYARPESADIPVSSLHELPSAKQQGLLDVLPRRVNLATIATIRVGIEAHIL